MSPTSADLVSHSGAASAGSAPRVLAKPASRARREGVLTEWLLRAFGLLAYSVAVYNLARAWLHNPTRMTLLMLLVTEGYTLLLVLIARRASTRDTSIGAVVTTVYAAFFFVLLDARGTFGFVPELVGVVLQAIGLAWQVASKVTLGRSFGLLPAHRRLVVDGPYRVVRHPIYFGYLVSHVAFALVNFSWRNLLVLSALYVGQVYRIHREEQMLSWNAEYQEYMGSVRWRLVPGIY